MEDFTDMNNEVLYGGGGKNNKKDPTFLAKIWSYISSIFIPWSDDNQNYAYSHEENWIPRFDNNNLPMESLNNDS